MQVNRFPENPLITPAAVPPSRADFEVVCAFNAGVARYAGETLLLLRVAERPRGDARTARVPVLNCRATEPCLEVLEFDRADAAIDFSDPRLIYTRERTYLTTLSHLRLARSRDGRRFTVDPRPALMPDRPAEAFGLEDPRITAIDGLFYIAYKSVSETGISVSLASTRDFVRYEKHGIIFGPENMDVCIFPETIHGRYAALHRPVSRNIAAMNMWLAYSHDLRYWGDHQYVMGVRPGRWDSGRIGGSTIPIKTTRGWLEIYHGATPDNRYCLGAVLLDLDEPQRVLARSREPLLTPSAPYETHGFLPNVIFSSGALVEDDRLIIYYGAGDEVMAGAELQLSEVLDSLDGRMK